MPDEPRIRTVDGERQFFRFTVNQRIQHGILALSVVMLALTGMPLKFHSRPWAEPLQTLFGGLESARVVHRVFGVILLVLFFFHIVYLVVVIYKDQVKPMQREGRLTTRNLVMLLLTQPLVPNLKDAKDFLALVKYLTFLTRERPLGTRFTWKEKADYWAPFWGMVVIGGSGVVLWDIEFSSAWTAGWVVNLSLIAHSEEALLAALDAGQEPDILVVRLEADERDPALLKSVRERPTLAKGG